MVFQCMTPNQANRINREMNRLLSSFFAEPAQHSSGKRSAAVNVWEKDDAWLVEAELPGVAADQLEISVVGDELTMSADHPATESEGVTYYRRERPRGSFSRTVQLPGIVNSEKVQANLVHGVLTVTLPKSDAARRRKIKVNDES